MAWVRQLPKRADGTRLWAASYYTGRVLPSGNPERLTVTDALQGVVEDIAAEHEVDVRRRVWLDPRGAQRTVESVWDEFGGSRQLEQASRDRDESHWRTHVKPKWGTTAVGDILKPHVAAWVKQQEKDGVGVWTIIAALNVMKAVLELAVDAGLINANPARGVKAPMPPKHIDRIVSPQEKGLILDRADELFPDRRGAWLFIAALADTGCRYEEMAAVRKEAVDRRRHLINVGPVQERNGRIREYPKGARGEDSAGFRPAPLGDELWKRLEPIVKATAPGERIFTAPKGGPLLYPTWRTRVWLPILQVPVVDDAGEVTGEWEPLVPEPLPTAHDLRHTFGTALADAGMARHDVQAALGHDDYRSSARYMHSDEDERLKRMRKAMGW